MKLIERLRQKKGTAVDRMTEITQLAIKETRQQNEVEKTEYEKLKAEVLQIDSDIAEIEVLNVAAAKPTAPTNEKASPGAEELRLAAERATLAEQTRQTAIRDRVKSAKLSAEFADELVKDNLSAEKASEAIFAELAHLAEAEPKVQPHHAAITHDAAVTMREGIANAMLHRANPSIKLTEAGRPYIGMSLFEIAKETLRAKGVPYQGESKMRIAELALTTSDFPNIAGSVVNATLRQAYEAAPSLWKLFSRKTSLSDFRLYNSLTLGENPQLELVNEHGEFHYGTVAEGKESYQLKTYGKIIAFTRQMIINDNLGAITRVANDWGVAAASLEANIVWGIITANAAMADTVALFHATHNNLLTGAGTALSGSALGAAIAEMAVQKGLDGVTNISAQAKYVMVPAALQFTVAQLLGTYTPAVSTNVIPDYIRSLIPISDPRLDANSTTAWYLAADPQQVPTIDYAYLDGQEGVYTETRVGFNMDAVEYKARLDFAAKAIDFRGLQKNAGS